jgi:hypothetical protein
MVFEGILSRNFLGCSILNIFEPHGSVASKRNVSASLAFALRSRPVPLRAGIANLEVAMIIGRQEGFDQLRLAPLNLSRCERIQ